MMAKLLALLLATSTITIHSKVYNRCELARELKYVHKFPDHQISTWVCIAKHESQFNTSAVNENSGDHGLFQISNLFWCSPPGNGLACNTACSAFEDEDITDDVVCVRRIFKEHSIISGNGFNAWTVYPLYCKNNVEMYTEHCFDNGNDYYQTTEKSTTAIPDEEDDDGYDFPSLPTPPKQTDVKKSSTQPVITSTTPLLKNIRKNFVTDVKKSDTLLTPTVKSFKETSTLRSESKASRFTYDYKINKPVNVFPVKSSSITLKPTTKSTKSSNLLLKKRDDLSHKIIGHEQQNEIVIENNSEYVFSWTANGFKFFKIQGAPILLSFPHLLYGDKEYLNSVEGLHPDPKLHETFVTLEPTSGAPLQLAKRVQFNMFIRAVDDIQSIENVTNALVPIFWLEESMTLDDSYVNIIKHTLLDNLKILEIIKWALITAGAIGVALPTVLLILKN